MPRPRVPRFVAGHRFLAASSVVVGATVAGGIVRRLVGVPEGAEEAEPKDLPDGERRILRGPAGTRVYTERFPGREDALLFTHGWCLNESVWLHQKRRFGRGPLSVVTWDLPGHGRSSLPRRGDVSLGLLVDAMARVVDQAVDERGRVVLVGHSLGGVLTLRYLLDHPETARRKVRGMVLLSTPVMQIARSLAGGWPGSAAESWLLGTAMHLVVGSRGMDRLMGWEAGRPRNDAISYHIVRAGFGDDPSPADVRLVRDAIASVPRQVRLQTFRAMSDFDVSRSLAALDVPALVGFGTKDRLVNPADTRALALGLPNAKALEFTGAGHAAFLERTRDFDDSLAAFARARLRARRRTAGPGGAGGKAHR
ncbi:MAG TPA: alpha/beta hydrolase [Actinomycetota bacterium]